MYPERGDCMGKYSENARYDVISIRVTEDEKRKIQDIATSNNINMTNFIREILFGSGLITKGKIADSSCSDWM
jgi:hypothetical protein